MATQVELAERLLKRFKGVPNYELTDAMDSVGDAMQVHGFALTADVPADKQRLVLLYAQSESAFQIAFSVAHYFKYTDGEESVDKSMIAENYRKLARELKDDYDAEKVSESGSGFSLMARVDRPLTTPPRRRRYL
ncbi:hypothetical protein [Bacillus sp. FSL K6-3431]|uniref:hypothetical protein n=1 Tax=Bacillus sp. FSL K6-3431 TaxID=2921500 RepID=UPI0030FA9041